MGKIERGIKKFRKLLNIDFDNLTNHLIVMNDKLNNDNQYLKNELQRISKQINDIAI